MQDTNWKDNFWPLGSPEDMSQAEEKNKLVKPSSVVITRTPEPEVEIVPAAPAPPLPHSGAPQPIQVTIHHPRPARPDPVQKQHLAEEAYSQIISTPAGLFAQGKSGTPHCIFPKHFRCCVYANPDIRYHTSACYYIYFHGTDTPLQISEKEFNNPKTLSKMLSQHFNTPVKRYDSQSKTDTLLQTFLASQSKSVDIHYYFGWIMEDDLWKYCIWEGKTHATANTDISELVDTILSEQDNTLSQSTSSAALTAVLQTADMMHSITNTGLRSVLWISLHMAALFSLLNSIGFRIPMGICLSSNEPRNLMAVEPLLSWFDDDAIQLTDEKSEFLQLLKERKDQPLLVWDAPSQVDNSKLLIRSVQTGNIEPADKHKSIYLELMAMPFILSRTSTTLSFSSQFIPLEIGDGDLTADAYDIFSSAYSYFEDYLYNFIVYVQEIQSQLPSLFKKCQSQVIRDSGDDSLSSKEQLLTLAIFRGVRIIMTQYYNELHPSQELKKQIDGLLSNDSEKLLIAALQQTSRYQDSSATVESVFFATANQKLLAKDFDVRKTDAENVNDPCDSSKQGIVFLNQAKAHFTAEAYKATCAQSGYSTRQVSRALVERSAFLGAPINNSTYMSKLHGISLKTKNDYVPVYTFAADRLALPKPQQVKMKSSSECDYTLQLGHDVNGIPIVWNGTNNSHICITGSTGSGKSYFMKKMISQLPEQNVRCIIFDTAGDFSTKRDGNPPNWPIPGTEIINIDDNHTQLNPFLPLYPNESNEIIATRFAELLSPMLQLGSVQRPMLAESISSALKLHFLSSLSDFSHAMKIVGLNPHISSKIDALCSRLPHGETPLEWTLNEPSVTVLNLHNRCGDDSIKILIEMLLSSICSLRMSAPQDSYPPIVLVLDECQLLNWVSSSAASQIMRRGRKYGLAAWLSTQYIADKKLSLALEQADLRLYFKPTPNEIPIIVRHLSIGNKKKEQYEKALNTLQKGQFICRFGSNSYLSQPPI